MGKGHPRTRFTRGGKINMAVAAPFLASLLALALAGDFDPWTKLGLVLYWAVLTLWVVRALLRLEVLEHIQERRALA